MLLDSGLYLNNSNFDDLLRVFRCILLNFCTILSFTIHFFINTSSCYETTYGQYIYILLLAGRINEDF